MQSLEIRKPVDVKADSVASAIRLASDKAIRLGYDINKMALRVTQGTGQDAGLWNIYFGPVDSINQGGGDVNIWVNAEDYSIVRVLRGQ